MKNHKWVVDEECTFFEKCQCDRPYNEPDACKKCKEEVKRAADDAKEFYNINKTKT